ncbi:MAG: hypothetical protein WKF96_16130 [Solirubrobacteraceae bacterium]
MAVCDIGGGANPLLSRHKRETLQITYTLVDIDDGELASYFPRINGFRGK